RTPPDLPFSIGWKASFIGRGSTQFSLKLKRKFFATALNKEQIGSGLGTSEERAQWATLVHGKPTGQPQAKLLDVDDPVFSKVGDPRGSQGYTWRGYWIPFQDQVHSVKDRQGQENYAKKKAEEISQIPVGSGCDLVLMQVHGGGFVDGYPLQTLGQMKVLMKYVQEEHNIKIGFLTVDYSLSPEVLYPVALNECVEAYRDLVKEYNVDPKRIILSGESAGGNLIYALSLKLRDELKNEMGLPAGCIALSPYFPDSQPLIQTIDSLTVEAIEAFSEYYTENNPEVLASQYYSPLNAKSLSGLPPSLILIGGCEVLRPSMELFVKRAEKDGVEIQTFLQEGRIHTWIAISIASSEQDRHEARVAMADFLAKIHAKHQ
ncbi:hypothetical protein BGZ76_004839, partial [Entomortierella beljakovae]